MHCFACRLGFVFIFFIIRFGIDFDMKLMVRFLLDLYGISLACL